MARQKQLTVEQFIDKANTIHNGRYDYSDLKYYPPDAHDFLPRDASEVEYIAQTGKVKITCPKHGPFWQFVRSHLNKSGCPYCKQEEIRRRAETQ